MMNQNGGVVIVPLTTMQLSINARYANTQEKSRAPAYASHKTTCHFECIPIAAFSLSSLVFYPLILKKCLCNMICTLQFRFGTLARKLRLKVRIEFRYPKNHMWCFNFSPISMILVPFP
uniref:Uncharacterized protein n=1 Tax=Ciona savignyi TaxID=51511 RepID=H2YQZ4_CIOSA